MKTAASLAVPLIFALSAAAGPNPVPVDTTHQLSARQCASSLDIANTIATRLQDNYFNIITGEYSGGEHWTDANNIENIHNLMLATGQDQWSDLADNSYLGRTANLEYDLGISLWSDILGGSWDDAQWIILALWKISDYKAARGDSNAAYLQSALTIYSLVEAAWDNTCGGGVWWSSADNYKNSVTNELFLLVSAVGAINFPSNTAFLTNAKKAQAWIASSALRNSQNLFNDGLVTATCANNGQTVWIYNQGAIAAGLGALYVSTGDESLLTEAELTLDATIAHLTQGGILKESCDDAVSPNCNSDQVAFKGIFMKHLQYYLDRANNATRTAKYAGFIHAQASGVYHYGTDSSSDIGSVWYAPSQGGSIFDSASSGSGLAAHIVNAKYGPCESL